DRGVAIPPGDAVAVGADRLYCSLAWATCSMLPRCTTRIICTFSPRLMTAASWPRTGPSFLANLPGEAAAELAWRLAELRPGMSVLDLACGHGELANRLAARGCQVTGLDYSAVFLDRARADAAAAGVSADYMAGDMRQLPWTGRFD